MGTYLIVGLGNIGDDYAHTRHNIGFDVVDEVAQTQQWSWTTGRLASKASGKIKGRQILLIKPTTYVNLSGDAVRYWMQSEKIHIDNVLVIVDDLAVPINKLKLRNEGSSGGHNGLKHIEFCLGTARYKRLRFGIGDDFSKGRQVDFVLGRWTATEIPIVTQKIKYTAELITQFPFVPFPLLMNNTNAHVFTS